MSLILTRELNQTIEIGSPWGFPTTIKIQDITNKQVRLVIDGPSAVQVNRGEVADSLRARTELMPPTDPVNFSLVQHLCVQSKWSLETFGAGPLVEQLLDHIEKEIAEVRKAPGDVIEWIDIAALAFDGAMRCGGVTAEEVVAALDAKAAVVRERSYPPVADRQPGKAVHHLEPAPSADSVI